MNCFLKRNGYTVMQTARGRQTGARYSAAAFTDCDDPRIIDFCA